MKVICGECHLKDENPELCHAVEPPMKKTFIPTDTSSCSFVRESYWQRIPKERQDEVNKYIAERSKRYYSQRNAAQEESIEQTKNESSNKRNQGRKQ